MVEVPPSWVRVGLGSFWGFTWQLSSLPAYFLLEDFWKSDSLLISFLFLSPSAQVGGGSADTSILKNTVGLPGMSVIQPLT